MVNRFNSDITEGADFLPNTSEDFRLGMYDYSRGISFSDDKPLDWILGWKRAEEEEEEVKEQENK